MRTVYNNFGKIVMCAALDNDIYSTQELSKKINFSYPRLCKLINQDDDKIDWKKYTIKDIDTIGEYLNIKDKLYEYLKTKK